MSENYTIAKREADIETVTRYIVNAHNTGSPHFVARLYDAYAQSAGLPTSFENYVESCYNSTLAAFMQAYLETHNLTDANQILPDELRRIEETAKKTVDDALRLSYNGDRDFIETELQRAPAHGLAGIICDITHSHFERVILESEEALAKLMAKVGWVENSVLGMALQTANDIAAESEINH